MKSPLRLPKSSNALAHVPHSRYRRVKKSQLPELQLEQAKIDEGSHDLAQTQKAMDQTIHAEHFVTGEEKGCEQAFGHHAMNVLSAIAGDSGLPFRFGNYRACHGGRAETRAEKTAGSAAGEERLNANRKQPDFVGMSFGVKPASREQPDRQMRMCGTVKGSWDDDLAELFGTMQAPFLRVRSGAQADEERRIWMCKLLRPSPEYLSC